jgi:hypothetical protein
MNTLHRRAAPIPEPWGLDSWRAVSAGTLRRRLPVDQTERGSVLATEHEAVPGGVSRRAFLPLEVADPHLSPRDPAAEPERIALRERDVLEDDERVRHGPRLRALPTRRQGRSRAGSVLISRPAESTRRWILLNSTGGRLPFLVRLSKQ